MLQHGFGTADAQPILDEAQAIKNPRSQTAQAAFCLKAKFRVALTGTPIENRLEELWSQMHFLCPGFLSGIKNFRKLSLIRTVNLHYVQ